LLEPSMANRLDSSIRIVTVLVELLFVLTNATLAAEQYKRIPGKTRLVKRFIVELMVIIWNYVFLSIKYLSL